MDIRIATSKDAPAVARQYLHLTAEMSQLAPQTIQPAPIDQSGYFTDYIEDANADVFLAEADGELLGFLLVVMAETQADPEVVFHRFGFVIDLYVAPTARQQGIGRALLAKATDWTRDHDGEFIQLNVLGEDTGARKFYQRLGFVPASLTLTHQV
ncbi:GNAT family N-acetyltransferase [Lacticaseibacillus porcinae]|uniref:GNAT family N-acetyltransferase n=1 Tax=Lacticaseibacillus porcinae TaxID=1123687 RepID=UPI000F766ECC|nr:GNAT family N-acetyltransferase [Lacticaseibacillus porcinae]